ncbi:HAD family hydrolase [Nocardiopsis sp. NPDC007018]|uniref:HAD family hydrolase n=1 Tax=Nocardiopsis sp. NPDC007018 TaxID=3155721 RepID=UPI0033F0654A
MTSTHQGVVFDLFGTLVDAPTSEDRRAMAQEIATVTDARHEAVETLLVDSWAERHDGRLRTRASLASHFARRCGAPSMTNEVERLLERRAAERLEADDSVIHLMRGLRARGLRVGVLSDASADIAQEWPHCRLAQVVDAAVFSCQARRIKPHPDLYSRVSAQLAIIPERLSYCGDGGGDELRGAVAVGLRAIGVRRRGGHGALAFGAQQWNGPMLARVEDLPSCALFGEGT